MLSNNCRKCHFHGRIKEKKNSCPNSSWIIIFFINIVCLKLYWDHFNCQRSVLGRPTDFCRNYYYNHNNSYKRLHYFDPKIYTKRCNYTNRLFIMMCVNVVWYFPLQPLSHLNVRTWLLISSINYIFSVTHQRKNRCLLCHNSKSEIAFVSIFCKAAISIIIFLLWNQWKRGTE